MNTSPLLVALALAQATPALAPQTPRGEHSWPSYHGPHGRGYADGFATPVEWDVEGGENIAWSTPVPGLSHSAPIIWGDRVYLTTAVKDGDAELRVGLYGDIGSVEDDSEHQFRLLCLDRRSGAVLWSRVAWEGVPAVKRHPKGSHAASTPATDGEHVAVFFGSEGLHVFDTDGERLWEKSCSISDGPRWSGR